MCWALIFLTHQFGVTLFRLLATLARNMVLANAFGMVILLCVLLMVRPYHSIRCGHMHQLACSITRRAILGLLLQLF